MSYNFADQSDFYAPSTPDDVRSDDESSISDFETNAETTIDSSSSFRLTSSKDQPTTIQDSIQESILQESVVSSHESNISSSSEDSFDHQEIVPENENYNNNTSKELVEDSESDLDETYDVRGRRLLSHENIEDAQEPNDSYQVIQAGKRNNNFVIRSSEENSAEVSEAEVKDNTWKGSPANTSTDSFPSPDDSFRLTATKKQSTVRNKIISSDEDSDSSPIAQRSYRKKDESNHDIEAASLEEASSLQRKDELESNLHTRHQQSNAKVIDDELDGDLQLNRNSSSRIPTPQMLRDALNKSAGKSTSKKEKARTSSSKMRPPDNNVLNLTDQIDDNSILEVSSTVVSFSSPAMTENKDKDVSIEEIPSSPEIVPLSSQELERMRRDLDQKQLLLKSCRLESLPDGGLKLKQQIRQLKETLDKAGKVSVEQRSIASYMVRGSVQDFQEDELRKQIQMKKWALGSTVPGQKERLRAEISEMERRLEQVTVSSANTVGQTGIYKPLETKGIKLLPEAPRLTDLQKQMFADRPTKELYKKTESGYISAAARREAVSVTLDSLENLHRSLASCPGESEKEPTPSCLTVPLLPHQERALKWLLWRETQTPAGGILADDMGLGKTLTMISLIVRQKELDPPPPANSDIWLSKTVKIKRSSGTLVVCPASVVGQWENEIKRRCKRNSLSIVIFHGPDRAKLAATLHQYDVVITTYQIVSREISNVSVDKKDGDSKPIGDFDIETHAKEIRQSVLLQIAFDRIVLDEAHVIRNPKSGVSQSVCRLRAVRRWAVTGTPVQNKELDMYSLLRFLRVSPFDQLTVWKRWVDSSKAKNEQAAGRLQLLIKTLLLRRTKDQKTEGSDKPLVDMPSREVHTHQVELSREENEVYQKLLAFSRKALEDYIKAQENRLREGYTYNRGDLPEMPQKNVTKQMMLVLLLRLRQVCSHPALIKTMLDATDSESLGSEDAKIEDDSNDIDLISKMSTMTIGGNSEEPKKEEDNFFTHTNPIFDQGNMSSKMRYIIDEVKKIIQLGQKAVVVSQWTSMLEVFAKHFERMRVQCHTIAGNVPLKLRTSIVEDFNTNPRGPPVMLLSLGAGGVGLNLIGGNHLFLADMHWNPQLEAQACDRVYRVGQKKDVHVHRMVTVGTVEERILQLQQQKLAMANGILTGAAKLATKGLTIEDLKMLFNPGPPAYVPKPYVDPYQLKMPQN